MRKYAAELTREFLERHHVTNITEDCRVFVDDKEIKLTKTKNNYYVFNLKKLDENDQPIKIPYTRKNKLTNKTCETYRYDMHTITLQRAMYAWFHGVVHADKVIDHKNNRRDRLEDYRLENLQEVSAQKNVTKDRVRDEADLYANYKLPTKKIVSEEYVEAKIAELEVLYEQAKANHDAKAAHSLRTKLARQRGLLKKLNEQPNYYKIALQNLYLQ